MKLVAKEVVVAKLAYDALNAKLPPENILPVTNEAVIAVSELIACEAEVAVLALPAIDALSVEVLIHLPAVVL